MKQIQGAIFDLDGTLLDSMGIWNQIDIEFLARRGLEVPPDYLQAVTPLGSQAAAEYTIARFGLRERPEELIREWQGMAYETYSRTLPLRPGVSDYVEKLNREGIPMAVATASDTCLVLPALERTGLLPRMKCVVTVREVARGKGYPDIYEKAAVALGCPPAECAVFEDIIEGIRGANAGGFYTVGVQEEHCLCGEAVMRAEADFYIRSFRELL